MENTTDHNYCLILAGGIGSRLWPMSRRSYPKQFLDIFGTGKTLLQETYDRFARFMDPNHIYISTNVDYLPIIYKQLPQVDDTHILEEPLQRGTLASVAWGTVSIKIADPRANIVVSPADQLILNEEMFRQDVLQALQFVSQGDRLTVMGIRPTRPETGYGYIQIGEESPEPNVTRVKTFTEKPEQQYAEIFLRDGSFLWNTGIFLFNVDAMLSTIYRLVPEYQTEIPHMLAEAETAEPTFLPRFFSMLPRLSIDMSIMEKSEDVYVYTCHFGWADLGTWGTLDAYHRGDENNNLLLNTRAQLYNCSNNIIRLPDNHVAIIDGLDGYVIAEEGDVLMICPKDHTATMRRMMREAQSELDIE